MDSDKEVLDTDFSGDTEENKWARLKSALGHVGLLVTLMVYTAVGGLVFQGLEQPAEEARLEVLRDTTLARRQHLVRLIVNNRDVSNLDRIVYDELIVYEETIQEAVSGGVAFPLQDGPVQSRWSLTQGVFFASTVLTTIGYGNIVPVTFWGRLFCVLFALVGLPLTLGVIADMGRLFATAVSVLYSRARPHLPHWSVHVGTAGRRSLSALAAVLFLVLYLAAGAAVFMLWEEEWGFFEGFYFCFITMTTIGFGDLVPKKPNYMFICTLYILVGLALTSTIFELVRRQYAQSWRQLQALSGPLAYTLRRLGESAGGSIDVTSLQRLMTAMGGQKRLLQGSGSKRQQREWEEAMAAVLRDITSPAQKQPPVLQIVIYESSV